jgi:pyruvate/2-oxoglutarate dehydrogenase complex dihydrolipoamide dehydrogenase (E3) component
MITSEYVVIGAGETGIKTTLELAKRGKKVLLIDQNSIGGSFHYTFDTPQQFFLEQAHQFSRSLKTFKDYPETYKVLLQHRQSLFTKIQSHLQKEQEKLQHNLQHPLITTLIGTASFVSKQAITVTGREGSKTITFKQAIICIGKNGLQTAHYAELQQVEVLCQHTVYTLKTPPTSLTIIGITSQSLIVADIYASLGIKVYMFDAKLSQQCAPDIDKSAFNYTVKRLSLRQVNFYFGTTLTEVRKKKQMIICTDSKRHTFECSHIYSDALEMFVDNGLQLKKADVKFTSKGIITNQNGKTNLKNVWALGQSSSEYDQLNNQSMRLSCLNSIAKVEESSTKAKNKSIVLYRKLNLPLLYPVCSYGMSELRAKAVVGPQIRTQLSNHPDFEGFWKIIFKESNDEIVGFVAGGEICKQLKLYALDKIVHASKRKEVVHFLTQYLQ